VSRALAALLALCCIAAMPVPPAPSGPWSAAVRDNMLSQMESALSKGYYFQGRLPAIRSAVAANRMRLVAITDPQRFADETTKVLYSATHDKHVTIFYSPVAMLSGSRNPTPDDLAKMRLFDRFDDHGYASSARLSANIGYLRIDGFSDGPETMRMIDNAMGLLSGTDALIIDLRDNHGGSPDSVDYLLGYFFRDKTQVTGFLWRDAHGHVSSQHKYAAAVRGPKYLDHPVYVLTSADTISGGEQFAYDLQVLKRATIVGQTTAGGANPGDVAPLTENFAIFVPSGTARNPVTGTNWEGVGVIPNVKTSANGALLEAYKGALKTWTDPLPMASQARTRALADPVAALKRSFPDQ
jgi:retinol-binding protein 3